jgi:3-methyladenine DNA glycosylase/8-oxoguanine DNA glycosylase
MPLAADVPVPDVGTHDIDLRRTLAWYRHGGGDPTTCVGATTFVRASWTPDGPATAAIDWSGGSATISAWGPGQDWARRAARDMTGASRPVPTIPDIHPLVTLSAHRNQLVRTGASGDLYGALLPTILEQRITAREAKQQWARLCRELGEPAPGPFPGLLLPPHPERLAGRPAWWFHPLGIEAKRARALSEVARVADRLWDWVRLPRDELVGLLGLVRGIGPWTIGSVLGPVCGDDDAVPVGDYHIPNMVAFNLAGEPRADDARMLSLLEPYSGVRGRVIRLLGWAGRHAPAYGPRRRILPMHRW